MACCDKAGMFYMLSMPCLVMVDNNQWSPDPSADWFGSAMTVRRYSPARDAPVFP